MGEVKKAYLTNHPTPPQLEPERHSITNNLYRIMAQENPDVIFFLDGAIVKPCF
jgi:hypothetical protein